MARMWWRSEGTGGTSTGKKTHAISCGKPPQRRGERWKNHEEISGAIETSVHIVEWASASAFVFGSPEFPGREIRRAEPASLFDGQTRGSRMRQRTRTRGRRSEGSREGDRKSPVIGALGSSQDNRRRPVRG